jgi:hypothetical protein
VDSVRCSVFGEERRAVGGGSPRVRKLRVTEYFPGPGVSDGGAEAGG